MVSAADPYVKRWGDVADATRGDVHYYNYEDDCEDEDIYPTARFVSEFGYQSHPSLQTYIDALPAKGAAEHLVNGSEFLSFRQRHPNGDAQMLRQLQRRFKVPAESSKGEESSSSSSSSSSLPFGDYVYLTQVQQSRCYDTAIRKWRRGDGGGGAGAARGTMGVLYWQLNDVWAGPTWSSVEHGGWRRKLLHHAVGRAFAPLAISVTSVTKKKKKTKKIIKKQNKKKVAAMVGRILEEDEEEVVELWSTCECGAGASTEGWTGGSTGTGTATVNVVSWSTGRVVHSIALPSFTSERFDSVKIFTGSMSDFLAAKCSFGECFLSISATLDFNDGNAGGIGGGGGGGGVDDGGGDDGGEKGAAVVETRKSRQETIGEEWAAPSSCHAELEYFPDELSGDILPHAVIRVLDVTLRSPNSVVVTLKTSHPAAYVRVETSSTSSSTTSRLVGTWSDAGFFMYPDRPVNLTFTSEDDIVDVHDFASSLTVTSLSDVLAKLPPANLSVGRSNAMSEE